MVRLTAEFWVDAYLSRLSLACIPAFVVHKGDHTAGAVIVKLNTLDGNAIAYQREYNFINDRREWAILSQGEEKIVDEALLKQRSFDPDLWVIEVEDRAGRHLLDAQGLND